MTVLLALSGMLCAASPQAQQTDANGVPTLVEVYWQWSRMVSVPALTNVVVLDPEIAKVEPAMDGLQIYGLERGETVVLGYLHDKPVSIRVRVIPGRLLRFHLPCCDARARWRKACSARRCRFPTAPARPPRPW